MFEERETVMRRNKISVSGHGETERSGRDDRVPMSFNILNTFGQ